jgi:hypothetical protein
MSKKARKYTKKQLRKLKAKILATLHELRHTPILDTALARSIARELRQWARTRGWTTPAWPVCAAGCTQPRESCAARRFPARPRPPRDPRTTDRLARSNTRSVRRLPDGHRAEHYREARGMTSRRHTRRTATRSPGLLPRGLAGQVHATLALAAAQIEDMDSSVLRPGWAEIVDGQDPA